MFLEVHIPDRIALNTDYIFSISEATEENAVIDFNAGDQDHVFICEESYDEVISAIGWEEDEKS